MADAGNVESLQREIEERREDLAATMTELRHVTKEKLDPRNIARDATFRGLDATSRAIERVRKRAIERPLAAGVIAAFVGLLVVAVSAKRRRSREVGFRDRIALARRVLTE